LTPLLSPRGNTLLRNVNIRPQNIVVEPILDNRLSKSLSVRNRTRAFPFWGIRPSVRRVDHDSIQEKMCEHESMVCVSRRSCKTRNGNVCSHASVA
jgi:hypothetical protein